VLAALERERDLREQRLLTGGDIETLRLDDRAAASRRLEKLEPERPRAAPEERDVVGGAGTIRGQPFDLRQLRLRLTRLRLLVAKAGDETLEPRDVLAEAVGGFLCVRRTLGLLATPGVPRAGEEGGAAGGELERRVRDRL
jgi:hypothetical protein